MEHTRDFIFFFICLDIFFMHRQYDVVCYMSCRAMFVIKGCIHLVSAGSDRVKGHIFFSRLNALTEEDKSWHQFNRNVLVRCHDLISCHPSPLVIPGPPHRATIASGDNSRGYGLTGGSPCTAALRERWTCSGPGCSAAFMREPGLSSPVSRVQMGSCRGHGAVKWKACHSLFRLMPSDCERLCHVPWLLTQWLGTSRQKPEPVRALCVLTEKCVFHLSSHWPEDSAGLTCPHPQSLTSWTQK